MTYPRYYTPFVLVPTPPLMPTYGAPAPVAVTGPIKGNDAAVQRTHP